MSSTNEELAAPPKPRISPLDYRNTDLVSRLLAATPPYLYNMPLVPNSYFFSEMLRSLVQAKSENNRSHTNLHQRRSRKRSWTQSRSEYQQKDSPKVEKNEMLSPTWIQKSSMPEKFLFENKKFESTSNVSGNASRLNEFEMPDIKASTTVANNYSMEKPEVPTSASNTSMMFPIPNQDNTNNMMLPPPPPIWYPPLYPTPYGIDPLHFFIDLRVSGHIYDRKNNKDQIPATSTNMPAMHPPTETSLQENQLMEAPKDIFRQSRHTSAFSVPIPSSKNIPMNLSNSKHRMDNEKESKSLKFDVKSMGFDKGSNKTSTHYVMTNIIDIYKQIGNKRDIELTDTIKNEEQNEEKEETEEEREKRVKDLRALIGLELVVDYMNHAKPGQPQQTSEESSTDFDSAGSPAVEVVAIHDDISQEI